VFFKTFKIEFYLEFIILKTMVGDVQGCTNVARAQGCAKRPGRVSSEQLRTPKQDVWAGLSSEAGKRSEKANRK